MSHSGPDQWEWAGPRHCVIRYHLAALLGTGKRTLSLASRKKGCSFSVREKGKVCLLLFPCPGLGEHFACKSPSRCTLLLFGIFATTVSYLIAASGKLFLSQQIIFAFCASI